MADDFSKNEMLEAQKQAAKLTADINSTIKSLSKNLSDIQKKYQESISKLNKDVSKTVDLWSEISKLTVNSQNSISNINNVLKEREKILDVEIINQKNQFDIYQKQKQSIVDINNVLKEQSDLAAKKANYDREMLSIGKQLNDLASKSSGLSQDVVDKKMMELLQQEKLISNQYKLTEAESERLNVLEKEKTSLENHLRILTDENNKLGDILSKQEQIIIDEEKELSLLKIRLNLRETELSAEKQKIDYQNLVKVGEEAITKTKKNQLDLLINYNNEIKNISDSTNKFANLWNNVKTNILDTTNPLKFVSTELINQINIDKQKLAAVEKYKSALIAERKNISDAYQEATKKQNEYSSLKQRQLIEETTFKKLQNNQLSDQEKSVLQTTLAANKLSDSEKNRLDILEKGKGDLESQLKSLEEQGNKVFKLAKEQSNQAKNLKDQISSLNTINGILDGIAKIYAVIINYADKYDQLLSQNAKLQGTNKAEIDAQYDAIQKINDTTGSIRLSNQEILDTVTELRKTYNAIAGQALNEVGKAAVALQRASGATVEESAKFFATLSEISGTSLQSQKNMALIANYAAQAAGVPLKTVLKDVANVSDGIRLTFKGSTEELIKQAAKLREIGSSLDSAGKSAKSLLTFDSSIQNELKASALLGMSLNFNESRRLFFAGKTLEAEKALLKEVEKVGDLDKLNYFQREALAAATGKSYDEIQKIISAQKTQLEAEQKFPELAEKKRKAQAELNALEQSSAKYQDEKLRKMLEEQIADTELNRLAKVREEVILNIGNALKPIYDTIMKIRIAFYGFLASITSNTIITNWVTVSIAALVGLTAAFFAIKFAVGGVMAFLGKAFATGIQSVGAGVGGALKGVSGGIRSLSNSMTLFSWSSIFKLSILMLALGGTAWLLSEALKNLGTVSADQIMAFTGSLVVLMGTLTLMGVIFAAMGPLGLVAIGALLSIGAAALAFGYAIKLAEPSIISITNAFTNLTDAIKNVIIDKLLEAFKSLPTIIQEVILPLVALAALSPGLAVAAVGVGLLAGSLVGLGATLVLFPTTELESVSKAFASLGKEAAGINSVITTIGNTLSSLAETIGNVLVKTFDSFTKSLEKTPTLLTGMLGPLTGLIAISPGLFLLSAGISTLIIPLSALRLVLTTFPSEILNNIELSFQGLSVTLTNVTKSLISLSTSATGLISIAAAMGLLSTPIIGLTSALILFPDKKLATITDSLVTLSQSAEGLNSIVSTVGNTLSSFIETVGNVLVKSFESFVNSFEKLTSSITKIIVPLSGLILISPFLITSSIGFTLLGFSLSSLGASVSKFPIETLQSIVLSFEKLPDLTSKIAISLTQLASSAGGLLLTSVSIGALTYTLSTLSVSLLLFPTKELGRIVEKLVLLGSVSSGLRTTVESLKEFKGLEIPKIKIDISKIDDKTIEQIAKISGLSSGILTLVDSLNKLTSINIPPIKVEILGLEVNISDKIKQVESTLKNVKVESNIKLNIEEFDSVELINKVKNVENVLKDIKIESSPKINFNIDNVISVLVNKIKSINIGNYIAESFKTIDVPSFEINIKGLTNELFDRINRFVSSTKNIQTSISSLSNLSSVTMPSFEFKVIGLTDDLINRIKQFVTTGKDIQIVVSSLSNLSKITIPPFEFNIKGLTSEFSTQINETVRGINLVTDSIKSLSNTLLTFPIIQLREMFDKIVLFGQNGFNIKNSVDIVKELSSINLSNINLEVKGIDTVLVSQFQILEESSENIKANMASLKELSTIELPKLDIDTKSVEALSKTTEAKEKQTAELKSGLDIIAQKLDLLTQLMANGGIAVNIDGKLVNSSLDVSRVVRGTYGQITKY